MLNEQTMSRIRINLLQHTSPATRRRLHCDKILQSGHTLVTQFTWDSRRWKWLSSAASASENNTQELGEQAYNINEVTQRCPKRHFANIKKSILCETPEKKHSQGLRRWACYQTSRQGCRGWDWKPQTRPSHHGEGSQSWFYWQLKLLFR